MKRSLVGRALAVAALMIGTAALVACASAENPPQFGPVLSPVQELVGTELTANRVVPMPCIPSRSDPVGVSLAMKIVGAEVADDVFTIDLQETDARLGSHPSGCSKPAIVLAQSVFLLDGDEAIFADQLSASDGGLRLAFGLGGRATDEIDVVILPTFEYAKGDGVRQTSIFGLIGRYSLT